MSGDGTSLAIAFAITLGISAAVVGLAGAVVWSGLGPEERATIVAIVAPRIGLLIFVVLLGIGVASVALQPAIRSRLTDARRLAEEAHIMLTANPEYRIF